MISQSDRIYPFKYLVFEGGGVRGCAYAGAYQALSEYQIHTQIEGICGTSIGAITALILALDYSPELVTKIAMDMDFELMLDGCWTGIIRLFRHFGWFKGKKALRYFRKLIADKGLSPDITFTEWANTGKPDLRLIGTDMNTVTSTVFSAATTPHCSVALAVRMSMSIPYIFASVPYEEMTMVDGGMLRNYPITEFDTEEGNNLKDTLGFCFSLNTTEVKIQTLFEFIKRLKDVDNAQQYDLLETDPAGKDRTVFIDPLGIKSTEFDISISQKKALYNSGYNSTIDFLRKYH